MDDSTIHAFLAVSPQGNLLYSEEKGEKSIPIAIQRIQKVGGWDPTPMRKITDNHSVVLTLSDREGQNIQAEVKIDQVARFIGRSEQETESFIKSGQLHQEMASAITQMIGPSIEVVKAAVYVGNFTPEQMSDVLKNTAIEMAILDELPKYGLSEAEYYDIKDYYIDEGPTLVERAKKANGALFVQRQEIDADFPRSVVCIAEGPMAGIYVILKAHGIEEIGVGTYNTATLCFNMDTGKKAIFRTGRAEDVELSEYKYNVIVSKYPEHFAGGTPISNKGPYRPRNLKSKDVRKQLFPQRKLGVAKQGFIMEYYKNGTLLQKINKNPFTNPKKMALFASSFADSLDKLHTELKIINMDIKLENTLIGADDRPRIADWGLAWDVGEEGHLEGTNGYMAPELVWAKYTKNTSVADPKMDVWSMGCLFSQIFNSSTWMNNMGILLNTKAGFDKYDKDPTKFEEDMKGWFPHWDDPTHPDSVIYDCLRWDPIDRITANEAALRLKAIADKY